MKYEAVTPPNSPCWKQFCNCWAEFKTETLQHRLIVFQKVLKMC